MKRISAFLSFAALLLAGCSGEQMPGGESGMTTADFTASLSVPATRVAVDGDGAGANVNRCIMEIYFNNELYKRLVQKVEGGQASFTNVPVAAGKTYQVLFWADCGEDEQADKYYNTASNLKAVTVKKDAFVGALAAGDNDKLDAFFCCSECKVTQNASTFTASLTRPFAQINVITTDVGTGGTVTSEALLPEKVSVSYTAATTFNVADGSVTGSETYSYAAGVYGKWSTVSDSNKQLTLSMDYLLASAEQGVVDVTFKTQDGSGNDVMTHSLTNLPYQRNYRTNVKGALLTVGGTWTATISKDWGTPDIVKIVEVADIASANEIIAEYASTAEVLEVQFSSAPTDAGTPTAGDNSPKAILTTPINEGKTLNIQVAGTTEALYVGDYKSATDVSSDNAVETGNNVNSATVNINIPSGSTITTLVINAPSKSVYINGIAASNVGTITNLEAYTSEHTLVIEKGQSITGTLTFHQGGLEIHGTVNNVTIPEGHGTISVRSCENLSDNVYDALKSYIQTGYVGVKGHTTEGLWDIVNTKPYVASESELLAAIKDTAVVEVIVKNNIALTAPVDVERKVTLNLNGKTLSPSSDWSSDSADDALVMVKRGGNLTVTGNGAIDAKGSKRIYTAVKLTKKGESKNGDVAALTVENGTLRGYYYAICGNGSRHDTELTVNGGTFLPYGLDGGVAIYHPQSGKFTVNGGTFTGIGSAIELRAGTLSITDGTFTSTSEKFSAKANGSGTTISGAALAISQHNTDIDINVTVNGGSFKGIYALYEDDLQNETGNVSVTVASAAILNGKVYSKHNPDLNPEEVKDADSFAKALADTKVDKITLGADITGDFTVAADRAVAIDLNGKKVTNSTGDTFTVALGGSLTIVGKGTVDNITHGRACIYNNGTVALNGGTYTRSKEAGSSKTESGGNSYYNILNHGTMTIAEGVTVKSSGAFSSLIANGYYNYSKSTDARSGYVNGTNAKNPSLVINGGSFTGGINTIKNDDGATLVINNGTFVNTTQACVQNSNVATINNGTFNPSGAVAVQSRYFDGGVNAGKTYINGGTFNGSLVSYYGGIFVFGNGFTAPITDVWDGKTASAVTLASDDVYEVTSGAELAWIAAQTRAKNTFADKTIRLMNDINLNNLAWSGIGGDATNNDSKADFFSYAFAGTFDGNGKTISNLNVSSTNENADYATAGLFNTAQTGAVIKNLTVKNATVTSNHYAGAIVGYDWIVGTGEAAAIIIENCTVDGATITSTPALKSDESGKYDNGDKAGGIIGYLCYGTVKGCTVKNTKISAYRDFGGIVGTTGTANFPTGDAKSSTISGNTVENVTLIVDNTQNYKEYKTRSSYNVSSYLGRNDSFNWNNHYSANLSDNSGEATIEWGSIPEPE